MESGVIFRVESEEWRVKLWNRKNDVIPSELASRGIFAFSFHLQLIQCVDPSTRWRSLRMTTDFFVVTLYVLTKADNYICNL